MRIYWKYFFTSKLFALAVSARLYALAVAVAPDSELQNSQFFLLCATEHNRKNWLFSDTPKGAAASATVYTMVEMAKAHDLNIHKYLEYLLENRPASTMSDEQLEQFAPWNETVKAACGNDKGDSLEMQS